MSGSPLTGGRKRRRRRWGDPRRRAPVYALLGCLVVAFILLWSLLELAR